MAWYIPFMMGLSSMLGGWAVLGATMFHPEKKYLKLAIILVIAGLFTCVLVTALAIFGLISDRCC